VNPEGKTSDFKAGDDVVYRQTWDGAPAGEDGVVTGVNEKVVFVRYGLMGSAATDPRDLEKR
jgi:hypothetical protein